MKKLEELSKDLSPELREEVEAFIQRLLRRAAGEPQRPPTFDWEGALKGLKDRYTSVELQHELANWRVSEE